jgi:hypothetical protein
VLFGEVSAYQDGADGSVRWRTFSPADTKASKLKPLKLDDNLMCIEHCSRLDSERRHKMQKVLIFILFILLSSVATSAKPIHHYVYLAMDFLVHRRAVLFATTHSVFETDQVK